MAKRRYKVLNLHRPVCINVRVSARHATELDRLCNLELRSRNQMVSKIVADFLNSAKPKGMGF